MLWCFPEKTKEPKRQMIEPHHNQITLSRQCERIGLARSSYSYEPARESEDNLRLMRLIDEQYTRTPFFGAPRMTAWLRSQGHRVNHNRIERLMPVMGLEAIYPKPRRSQADSGHTVYPYWLKGLEILRPDQVWCTDITDIRLARGFVYLVAIMDWYSRYVLSWEVSNRLEVSFCLEALKRALGVARPEIFNSLGWRSILSSTTERDRIKDLALEPHTRSITRERDEQNQPTQPSLRGGRGHESRPLRGAGRALDLCPRFGWAGHTPQCCGSERLD